MKKNHPEARKSSSASGDTWCMGGGAGGGGGCGGDLIKVSEGKVSPEPLVDSPGGGGGRHEGDHLFLNKIIIRPLRVLRLAWRIIYHFFNTSPPQKNNERKCYSLAPCPPPPLLSL